MPSLLAQLFDWRPPRVSSGYARRRAARGAAYLDDVDPGWHRRLDLGALALADGERCVLGQLHGNFRNGLGRARLFHPGSAPRASLSPVAYGFHCVHADDETKCRDYTLLNRAWETEVRDRYRQDRRVRENANAGRQAPPPCTDRPQARHEPADRSPSAASTLTARAGLR